MKRKLLIVALMLAASFAWGQGQNFPGGSSSSGTTASGILSAGLLAEYKMTECSGTTISDSSGQGNTGTFGAQAPTWLNGAGCATTVPYSGLQFVSGSSQFVTLPAALNSARTVFLVTEFNPVPTNTSYMAPVSGNGVTANNWGAFFANLQGGLSLGFAYPFSGGGEYMVEGWSTGGVKVGTIQSASGINIFAWTLGSAGDSTHDQVWVNNNVSPFVAVEPPLQGNVGFGTTGQSAGVVTGNFQLGGSASGKLLASFASFYNGNILLCGLLFYLSDTSADQPEHAGHCISDVPAWRAAQPPELRGRDFQSGCACW